MGSPAGDTVEKQLAAYHALDAEAFASFYADDAVIFKNARS